MNADAQSPLIFDRDLLRRRRLRAAPAAAAHAFLLDYVAADLAERLSLVTRSFGIGVDLGAGLGLVHKAIAATGKTGPIVRADLVPPPRGTEPTVVVDEEALPFADGSLDLVVSGLSLHLVNDLPGALAQIRRALKPDGLLLAALLGPASLRELRCAFTEAEIEVLGGASPRVAPFADVRTLGALLQRVGFALPVTDSDCLTVTYPDPLALMRDLRGMGAANMLVERSRRPLRRAVLARALEIYRREFSAPGGRVRATFEIVTMSGWAPHESQQKPLRPGTARASLQEGIAAASTRRHDGDRS